MTGLNEHLAALIEEHPEMEADELAAAVMATARTRAALAALVFPAVKETALIVRRQVTARVERQAFGHIGGEAQRRTAESADPVGDRRRLLSERFALGDGRWVAWADATVEDHRQRVAYLLRKKAGLEATIDRHAQAIEEIEAAGVSCLGDIQNVRAAA